MRTIFFRTLSLGWVLALALSTAAAATTPEIEAIQARYKSVNKLMKEADVYETQVQLSTEGCSAEYYTQNNKLIRIIVSEMGESYRAQREFTYDENEKLVFIFNLTTRYNAYLGDPALDMKKSQKTEDRFYLKDERALLFLQTDLAQKHKRAVSIDLAEDHSDFDFALEHAKDIRKETLANMKADKASLHKSIQKIKANYKVVNAQMKSAKPFETTLLLSTEGEGVTLYTHKGKLIRIVVDDTSETYRARLEFTYDENEKLDFIFSRLTRYNAQIGDPSLDMSKSRVAKEERLYLQEGQALRYLVRDFDEENKGQLSLSLKKNQSTIEQHLDYAERVRKGAQSRQKSHD